MSRVSDVRAAVRAKILTLGLPITAVYERFDGEEQTVDYPCCVLSTQGLAETERVVTSGGGTAIGYGVRVMFLDRPGRLTGDAAQAAHEAWREAVDDAFRNKALAGVPEVLACRVERLPPGDPVRRAIQRFASGLVVRAVYWVA